MAAVATTKSFEHTISPAFLNFSLFIMTTSFRQGLVEPTAWSMLSSMATFQRLYEFVGSTESRALYGCIARCRFSVVGKHL